MLSCLFLWACFFYRCFLPSAGVSSFLLHHILSHGANALNISHTHLLSSHSHPLGPLLKAPLSSLRPLTVISPPPPPPSCSEHDELQEDDSCDILSLHIIGSSPHTHISSILRETMNHISDQLRVKKKKIGASVAASSFMGTISFGRKSIQSPRADMEIKKP